jgi:hypothetical protein
MAALEVMLMLPPLHLFINQEAIQAANTLLRNGCSYGPNFWHSDVLIGMTDETPLLLSPRDKFVTLKIFDLDIFCRFPYKREDWSTEYVDLVSSEVLFRSMILGIGKFGRKKSSQK